MARALLVSNTVSDLARQSRKIGHHADVDKEATTLLPEMLNLGAPLRLILPDVWHLGQAPTHKGGNALLSQCAAARVAIRPGDTGTRSK